MPLYQVIPAPQPDSPKSRLPLGTYEAVIDDRLERTRRYVRSVDVAFGCMTLVAGVLIYLTLAMVLDHWVFTGGLGFRGRLVLWTLLVVGATGYFLRWILPAMVRRVNPVYAAQAIEQSRSSLKNSLINFLLLRGERERVAQVVYEAIEQRAASDLRRVSVETTVDRSHVLRLGYILAGMVVILAMYLLISPKNPLISFRRVIWPWAHVAAPTRVVIDNVEPGDWSTFLGEFAAVTAEVSGLNPGEGVTLYYTTADQQIVGAAVPMTVSSEGYRWRCVLPPGSLGLQQDLDYYLAAGDARTPTYHVQVQVNPVIVVERVDYHYPPYTGISDESVEHEGNLRAIEGTQVTLHAKANQEIARAEIDLDCTGKPGLVMKSQATDAAGQFVLRMKPDAPEQPEYTSYQLRFTDTHKRDNRQPIRHRIEVLRDLPPEVQVVEPAEEEVAVAENGQLDIRVRAADPDFGLRQVVLRLQRKGTDLPVPPLLRKPFPAEPLKGEFKGSYRFEPAKLGLKAGEHVVCWAEADDNRATDDNQPKPNRTESFPKRRIAIVDSQPHRAGQPKPGDGQEGPRQPANQDQRPDQPQGQAQGQREGSQARASAKNQKQDPSHKPDTQPGAQQGDPQPNRDPQADSQPNTEQRPQGAQASGAKAAKSDPAQAQKSDPAATDQQSATKSSEQNEPVDPQTDPGTAFERMAKFFDDQKKKQQPDQNQPNDQQNKPGDKSQQLASNQDQQQTPSKPDQQQGGQEKSGQQQGGEQAKSNQQGGQGSGGQQQPGTQPKEGQKTGGQGKSNQPQSAGPQEKDAPNESDQPSGGQGKGGSQQSPHAPSKPDPSSGDPDGQDSSGRKPSGAQAKTDQQAGNQGTPTAKSDQQSPAGQSQPGKTAKGQTKADQQPGGTDSQLAKADQQPAGKAGEKGSGEKGPGSKPDQQPSERLPGNKDQRGESSPSPSGEKGSTPKAQPTESSPGTQADKNPADKNAQKSGSKSESNDKTGSTPSQEGKGPSDKAAAQAENRTTDKPSGGADSFTGPKKSDSRQDIDGDRSGGGGKGAGQQAKQSGSNEAGSHSSADQGGARADEKGDGPTGQRGGDQAQAKDRTGNPAGQKPGENTRPGEKSGEGNAARESAPRDDSQNQAAKKPPSDGPSNKSGSSDKAGDGRINGNPLVGGRPNSPTDVDSPAKTDEPGGDEANLDYAAQQTDLVLEALREQLKKGEPDPELLKRLGGWSRKDLEDFHRRWEQMKRSTSDDSPQAANARQQFRNALRSLGLKPKATVLQGGKSERDQLHNLNESRRTAPPPSWAPLLKAYTEGVAGQK